MNRYEELCTRQQKIFNSLPIAYAFTEDHLILWRPWGWNAKTDYLAGCAKEEW